MPVDLFKARGITVDQPRDLFAERGIVPYKNNTKPIDSDIRTDQSIDTLKSLPGFNDARNIAGGIMHGTQSLLNALPNVTDKITPSNNLLKNFDAYKVMGTSDKSWNTREGAEQTFGEMLSPGPEGLRSGVNAVRTIASPITNAFLRANPREVAQHIQHNHDFLEHHASSLFNTVGNEVEQRGLQRVPIDRNLIDSAEQHLPHTRNSRELLNKSRTGNYEDLRKLQADLWQRGTKASRSNLASERDAGEEMMDLRDHINESIANHFTNTGHEYLGDILNIARNRYRHLRETYYGSETPNAIKKLVDRRTRKIPRNVFNVLREESIPMERIRQQNPLIAPALENVTRRENARRRIAYGIGLTGAGEVLNHARNIFGSRPVE